MEPVPNRAPKYNPDTSIHEIQLRKGKGKFKTLKSYQGKGLQAAREYRELNIGRGYVKRFVVDGNVTHKTMYNPLGE